MTHELPEPIAPVLHCHCENCRRLSGNFVAAVRSETAALTIRAVGDALAWYDLDYAQYGFCRRCGSTLYYRAAEDPETTSVMVGTLDDASELALGAVWFTAEAQGHNVLPGDVPHHPGNA